MGLQTNTLEKAGLEVMYVSGTAAVQFRNKLISRCIIVFVCQLSTAHIFFPSSNLEESVIAVPRIDAF